MKVLFSTLKPVHLKNFDSAVRELGHRGHDVDLAVHRPGSVGMTLHQTLSALFPNLHALDAPDPVDDPWHRLALEMRAVQDHLHFEDSRFNDRYRARAERRVPPHVLELIDGPFRATRAGRRLIRSLVTVERALPAPPVFLAWLEELRPDVVVLTPYLGLRSVQPDLAKAARTLGIPTVAAVYSWDNLSSKSLMRPRPELVTVWNETQRAEAVELHGIDPARIAITGAQNFDPGFEFEPSSRDQFCARAGLEADRPYVLYTCMSPFAGEPPEVGFVSGWLQALRESGRPELRDVGVLVRPHFKRGTIWRDADLSGLGPVVVWPPVGAVPAEESSRRDFQDSMHHSVAVVGLNTSAMIDAAIAGKPVHTVLAPEFHNSQEGTLHFRYLREVGGGALRVARDLDEHVDQLAMSVAAAGRPDQHAREFVERFVRPLGIDRPAAPILVDAIERAAEMGVRRRPARTWLDRALRRGLDGRVEGLVEWERRQRLETDAAETVEVTAALPIDELPELQAARDRVAALASDAQSVIAGPWVHDAHFELLYWIPFLTWAVEEHPGLAERLIVVSRGGADCWYAHLGARYLDLLDVVDAEELRSRVHMARAETRKRRDPFAETPLDRELVSAASQRLGVRDESVLHPSLMSTLVQALLHRRGLGSDVTREVFRHRPPAAPELPADLDLPGGFVVADFSHPRAFPATPANVGFARNTLSAVGETTPVVLLDPASATDGAGVVRLDQAMDPRHARTVQTAVLARAQAFVGTYGPVAHLAALAGVPSFAVYSHRRFRRAHADFACRALSADGFGPLSIRDSADLAPAALAVEVLAAREPVAG